MGTSGAHWQSFKLDVMEERDNIRLIPGKLWDERQRLEGQGAGKGPQLVTLNCTGHTGADLQSYGDEQGTLEAKEANRETPRMNGIKGCSHRKVTHLLSCIYVNVQTGEFGSHCAARKL